jgi:NADPH:quinone reductase-like Zn-dependent oxidoreductase
MKAVQIIGYGDAVENLQLRDVPEPPPPGKGEVLVGMEYAPINFNDLMVPWGVFPWKPTLPATIGNEGAGIVLALGADVKSVAVGERVVLPPLLDTLKTYQLSARAARGCGCTCSDRHEGTARVQSTRLINVDRVQSTPIEPGYEFLLNLFQSSRAASFQLI